MSEKSGGSEPTAQAVELRLVVFETARERRAQSVQDQHEQADE